MTDEHDLSAAIEQHMKLHGSSRANSASAAPDAMGAAAVDQGPAASAELPPSKQKTADEVLEEMKKVPLFMTSLDELDEDNEQIQALKAIAYEGTRAEIASNFRDQGNECVRSKQYLDAREFYNKAIQALKGPIQPQEPDEELSDQRIVEIDEETEEKKERAIEEACYANRALCNLEMSITAPHEHVYRAMTDEAWRRELRLLPTRLCPCAAAQCEERQGMVSGCFGLSCC